MDPPDIERLDERTVQRIAAGEVVERPASVVKELVENSLDAGASRVAVSVEAGGTEGIRVRDDGIGIPADQLTAAVAEHATSKISDIADLDRGVATLGFRGEALYTVGAVSRLTVRSRPSDTEVGAEISVEGGEVGEVRPAGCPEGTTVEVDDLFYNTPARKKFLKRETTEFDHVNTVVTGYALANPDVAISLEHDGRETFATEGNGDLRSAVLAVYGREVAESMVDVEWEPAGAESASTSGTESASESDQESASESTPPVERVSGLVSHPETTRSSREYLATFVNGRYVTASTLREAVIDAYAGQLAPDRYPFAVLFVEVPAGDVDVNVHPRKLEVRFDRERAVKGIVEEAVEAALLDHGLIRSTAPRGRSAPDETDVSPEAPDGEIVGGAGTDRGGRADRSEPTVRSESTAEADPSAATELAPDDADAWAVDGLGGDRDGAGPTPSGSGDGTVPSGSGDGPGSDGTKSDGIPRHASGMTRTERPSPREWQTDSTDDGSENDDIGHADNIGHADDFDQVDYVDEADGSVMEDEVDGADGSDRSASEHGAERTGPSSQRTLVGGATSDERTYDSLPPLRVLGQLHDTYVVAETADGLVLIDQHAADERVNYERLRRSFADGADAQALAAPVIVELTAREAALFGEFVDDLASIGFRAERAGEREVRVEAVPTVFDAALDPELLRDVLSAFVGDAADGTGPVEDVVDELLADLACYPSVTGNTPLTEGSVVDLLECLDDCENPYACPHGRPVVIRFDRDEVADRFERDYPGHAGRRAE